MCDRAHPLHPRAWPVRVPAGADDDDNLTGGVQQCVRRAGTNSAGPDGGFGVLLVRLGRREARYRLLSPVPLVEFPLAGTRGGHRRRHLGGDGRCVTVCRTRSHAPAPRRLLEGVGGGIRVGFTLQGEQRLAAVVARAVAADYQQRALRARGQRQTHRAEQQAR